MNYEPVIGLEVHAQLKTRTKAFCGCSTEFGRPPNSQTCPVCLGLPGALPVLNESFLRLGMRTALALECTIAHTIKFDRKNYFYPDLPKNYQISQFDMPLAARGRVEIETENGKKAVRIRRVHLEEDAGKLTHTPGGTLVDFNRSGMPLLEIVTEPDIFSAQEAYAYLTALKSILEYLEVCDCDMEKGSLRCDANISLRPAGHCGLGVKTELKNMNTFKGARDALNFEIARQQKILASGEKIIQETRLWDAERQRTLPMRAKEEAHDYRYFPEPDLVPFTVTAETIGAANRELPELPAAKKARLADAYGLSGYDAAVLAADKHIAVYFEEAAPADSPARAKAVANWLMGDIMSYINAHRLETKSLTTLLPPERLSEMLDLIGSGTISGKIAKEILPQMLSGGKTAAEIIREKNLSQISDAGRLEEIVAQVLRENAKVADDFRAGTDKALMFLVGQVMKKTRGKANPQMVNNMIIKKLKE